jgi:hypothetical protein
MLRFVDPSGQAMSFPDEERDARIAAEAEVAKLRAENERLRQR